MQEFEFTLKFSINDTSIEPDFYIERLGEEGCDDALIGVGQKGRIALQFNREANNASEAIFSAIQAVKRAIPNSKLIEATPDIVELSDIDEVLGFSSQNIRKLMLNNRDSFPTPVHEGKTTAFWHLSSVLIWLKQSNSYSIDGSLLDVAKTNMQFNIAKEVSNLELPIQAKLSSVFGSNRNF